MELRTTNLTVAATLTSVVLLAGSPTAVGQQQLRIVEAPPIESQLPTPADGLLPSEALSLLNPVGASPPHSLVYGHSQPTEASMHCGCRHNNTCSCGSCTHCKLSGRCKARLQYKYWGYPAEFHERPFGSIVRAQIQQQVLNGIAAQSALYLYDFYPPADARADQLTARGAWQLRKIARHILEHSVQVTVESTGHAELDAARREAVFNQLAAMAVPVPQEQIVTGVPRPNGMKALEALPVFQNQLADTASKGAFVDESGSTDNTFSFDAIGGEE